MYPFPVCVKTSFRGSLNSEEKWFLSRGGAWDGSLIEGVCCWGSCHVEGRCLSVCLFDCQSGVRVMLYCCCFSSTVNIYGHVRTVSSPTHTFPGQVC